MDWFLIIFVILMSMWMMNVAVQIFFIKRFWKNIKAWWQTFRNKDKHIMVNIVMPNAHLVAYPMLIDMDNDVDIDGNKYIIDKKNIVWRRGNPHIYFFFRNPNSINFDEQMKALKIDTENYRSLMKQKLIRDLLTESKYLLIILIVVIVNALISLVTMLKVMGILDKK